MVNMIAECLTTLAHSMLTANEALECDILLFPEGKRRAGQAFDELKVAISRSWPEATPGTWEVRVVATITKANGQVAMKYEKALPGYAEARHFLRAVLANVKPFDFKTHEPFYTIGHDAQNTKPV
jgi:hypothetical protein